ncbi:hypothetical protein V6C42_15635 [Pseudoclostridium thermosuccinogenes]|uniref:hypothetical protein n=1 Tax=Clostridium thermosuccinogenes TaxID=84032 RepID=UPI002FDA3D07
MDYSWKNDDLWQIRISEKDFEDFEQPYIGNGIMGTRFDKLVVGTERKPLYTLTRTIYDGGKQLLVPAWNHIFLEIGGVEYLPQNGKHHLTQVLDIRNGVVTMTDQWGYKDDKTVTVNIEMFIPRTFGCVSYLSFGIENLDDTAQLKFGILGNSLTDCYQMSFCKTDYITITGDYRTAKQARPVSQAIKWKSIGLETVSTNVVPDGIEVSAVARNDSIKLELFHAISSYEDSNDTLSDVVSKVKRIYELGRDEMYNASSMEWKRLWKNGLAFRNGDFEIEKSVLVHQFYLLCSLEISDCPLGPLGLSKNEWGGCQLWDADFWLFRAVLPLWPEFAKAILSFREKTLEKAKEHARVTGYKGAWYAWMTDEEGRNITPPGYNDELHVNIWIALAAWEYYLTSKDKQFLTNTGWLIISAIADFFTSRVELDDNGRYHLKCVLGPDESVFECGRIRVNDNFLTNYGVKRLMEIANRAAGELCVDKNEKWEDVGENIYILKPDENGIIPEYKGYDEHGIKQADVILAFYPLGFQAEHDIIRKNIKFYRDKQMYYGPLMSSQIESCIFMKLGEKKNGLKRLFYGMREFTRGKHYMPFECRDKDNSIMLTGIGGEIQALIFGYYEADLNNLGNIPRIAQYMDESKGDEK